MRVRVHHTLELLEQDLTRIATTAKVDMAKTVRAAAVQGNKLAKGFARESAGDHGKHYHKAFTAEAVTPLVWEYGPDATMPQGGMSFERGSRNQPPHLDLAKSADIIGAKFASDVADLPDEWFW